VTQNRRTRQASIKQLCYTGDAKQKD